MRPSIDEIGLRIAETWALRATCARRQVGCSLFDSTGHLLATGYNGPASGQPNCEPDNPCLGYGAPSGQSLQLCEAIHAEANALLRCADVTRIHTCYVTHSPCLDCVKLLLNTSCMRIIFRTRYAHDEASKMRWLAPPVNWLLLTSHREWIQL